MDVFDWLIQVVEADGGSEILKRSKKALAHYVIMSVR
jgi:hypothetical protein